MRTPPPIGFFDSGVGGLSILTAARQLLPREQMLYLADTAHFPYGAMTPEGVKERATCAARFLIAQRAGLIVIACNTATVHALADLRARFPGTPFVGVVPVVKTLATETRTGTIAILSTPTTAASPYLAALIATFAGHCTVLNIACPGLADLIEGGAANVDPVLAASLAPLRASAVDVVGLGCTHYPFVGDRIQHYLPSCARLFDSGLPVARRIRSVLAEQQGLSLSESPSHCYFTTGDPERFRGVAERLLRLPIKQVSRVAL